MRADDVKEILAKINSAAGPSEHMPQSAESIGQLSCGNQWGAYSAAGVLGRQVTDPIDNSDLTSFGYCLGRVIVFGNGR